MSIARTEPRIGDPAIYVKATRLLVGRVALVLLLLLASYWRTGDLTSDHSPEGLLLLFTFTFACSIAYFVLLRWASATIWQIRFQFAVDVVSITWLVVQTGDLLSPYVTLYIVLISVAGFFLGKTETLILSLVCALSFTALSVFAANRVIYSAAGEQPVARIVQIAGVNVIAILLVGLLAARLSERRRLSEELKHSEESFADLHLLHERIVESIGSGLITTDLSGRIYAFNSAAESITGFRTVDALGKNVSDVFGTRLKAKLEECIKAVREGSTGETQFEFAFQNGTGPPKVRAACTVVPLLGKSRATTGLIVTLQDVTHMRDLEESVRRSDRLAAVGRMAAGLAHEIRNPLGSMSSALQFLQDRSPRPAEEAKLMDIVLRESDRMNNIISNFLAFARPAVDGSSEKREVVNLTDALSDCLSLIRHSPEVTSTHKLEIVAEPGLKIDGNETQLKQVCWNLARNALEAMPEGGEFRVSAFSENGNVVTVFRDTGSGMDQEMLDRMFEPFVSGSGGTGLGLSIVHRIIQEHGGRIDVKSELGKGTSVTVEFPRARV